MSRRHEGRVTHHPLSQSTLEELSVLVAGAVGEVAEEPEEHAASVIAPATAAAIAKRLMGSSGGTESEAAIDATTLNVLIRRPCSVGSSAAGPVRVRVAARARTRTPGRAGVRAAEGRDPDPGRVPVPGRGWARGSGRAP